MVLYLNLEEEGNMVPVLKVIFSVKEKIFMNKLDWTLIGLHDS